MQDSDYRKEYVTCEAYKDSDHTTSKVNLMAAFTGVSTQPAFLIMKMKTFSGFAELCLFRIKKKIYARLGGGANYLCYLFMYYNYRIVLNFGAGIIFLILTHPVYKM